MLLNIYKDEILIYNYKCSVPMKVAIIEVDTLNHHSLIFNWVNVCFLNKWHVTLFTTEEIYENVFLSIKDLPHEVVLMSKGDSYFVFLNSVIIKSLKYSSFDLAIILTLQSHILEMMFFNPNNIKIGITIHNSRTWFNGNHISKPSHYIKRIFRKLWLKRASFYIVNSENMYNYIFENHSIDKRVFVMPFLLRRRNIQINKYKFKVVYPGMISTVRKSYDQFIDLAKKFKNIEFVLLGAPNKNEGGDKVIELIDKQNVENIRYYPSFVDADTFNHEMSTATILFSDLNLNYRNSDLDEIYGITKDSGVSYLMSEYLIPGIFNNGFTNLNYLSSGTFYFDNAIQLQEIIEELFQPGVIEKIRIHLKSHVDAVNIENVSIGFAQFLS